MSDEVRQGERIDRRAVLKASAGLAGLSAMSGLLLPRMSHAAGDELVATIKAGRVRGTLDDGVNIFKGVRYGADTARARFQAPRPPMPWTGVLNAIDYGNQTPQPSGGDGVRRRAEGGQRYSRHGTFMVLVHENERQRIEVSGASTRRASTLEWAGPFVRSGGRRERGPIHSCFEKRRRTMARCEIFSPLRTTGSKRH